MADLRENGYDKISLAHSFLPEIEANLDKINTYEPVIATDTDELVYKGEDGTLKLIGGNKVLVEPTIDSLTKSTKYVIGDVVEVLGYYTKGDGAEHWRKIASVNDGSGVALSNGLFANQLYVNTKIFNETYRGAIFKEDDMVEPAKLYLNLMPTSKTYKSYLYFDYPKMPNVPNPSKFSDTYGGDVKDGSFIITERTGGTSQTNVGYRAGYDSITTNGVFIGTQAGERSKDPLLPEDENLTGGSVGVGVTSLYQSTGKCATAIGTEAGQNNKADHSVYVGMYSGNSNEGNKGTFVGMFSGFYQKGRDCASLGYGTLRDNTGNNSTGIGCYSLGNNTGDNSTAVGYRAINYNSGVNNTSFGYFSGFTTNNNTKSNRTHVGSESGREDLGGGTAFVGNSSGKNNSGEYCVGLGYASMMNNIYNYSIGIGAFAKPSRGNEIKIGSTGATGTIQAVIEGAIIFRGTDNYYKLTATNNVLSVSVYAPLNNAVLYRILELDTPYYTAKMQKEGVYDDFVAYMDESIAYSNANKVQGDIAVIPNITEPVPSDKLLAFKDKYLP